MKTLLMTLAAGAVALSFTAGQAQAGAQQADPVVIRSGDIALAPTALGPQQNLGLFQKTQWFWGNRNYCWYDGGWRGPGFYWCGYAWRRGYGWGGPIGWRGWDHFHPGGPAWRGGGWHGGGGFHGGGGYHGGGGHGGGGFHGGGGGHGGGGHGGGGHEGGGGHHR